jgi:hypothetical protein
MADPNLAAISGSNLVVLPKKHVDLLPLTGISCSRRWHTEEFTPIDNVSSVGIRDLTEHGARRRRRRRRRSPLAAAAATVHRRNLLLLLLLQSGDGSQKSRTVFHVVVFV